jgi:hypothetical protein
MNKTLETQLNGVSYVINPVPGDLLIWVYDSDYALIEDMPLYLIIERSENDYYDDVKVDNIYSCNTCFTLLIATGENAMLTFSVNGIKSRDNSDTVILDSYVRVSDLISLDDDK